MPDSQPILEVLDLHVHFKMLAGVVRAVDGVNFTVERGRCLGIVGESGCGKSVTARSILRLLHSSQTSGQILYHPDGDDEPIDLVNLDPRGDAIRAIRGKDIAMIFQEPMTAFSPVHTVGNQIMEALFVHGERDKRAARKHVIALLDEVGIPAPERRIDEYPFQLSGGMRQRSMIAMAIILNPRLLIADEPTTALDVTIQAQILRLMKRLQRDNGMAIMFITHDLGVIANMADDVAVMYLGKIVEYGASRQIFNDPKHPYTKGLMRSIPKFGTTVGKHLATIKGTVPVPLDPPDACPFASRCGDFIAGKCDVRMPAAVAVAPGHSVNCVLYE